jgi:hypothetical protein
MCHKTCTAVKLSLKHSLQYLCWFSWDKTHSFFPYVYILKTTDK